MRNREACLIRVSEICYQQFSTGFCFLLLNLSENLNHLILDDSSGLRDLKQVAFKPFWEFESIQESKYIKMSNYEFGKFLSLYFNNTED